MIGPPMMAKAVVEMLDHLEAEPGNIHFDDLISLQETNPTLDT